MKKDTLSNIAEKLNISKSTVSKALRHCSGVDSATRQMILDAAQNTFLTDAKPCSVYIALPETPNYFWNEMRRGIQDGQTVPGIPFKYNIYTKCTDEATILTYLREAEEMNVQVLVLAAYVTPEIHRVLEEMREHCFIIFLSEYHRLTNSFYIGADSFDDGYRMGKQYLAAYSDRKLVVLRTENDSNALHRLEGFLTAVRESSPDAADSAVLLNLDRSRFSGPKIFPARLAAILSDHLSETGSYCIYVPTGMDQLPLAVKKAGLDKAAVCMCHDCFSDGFSVLCNQDVYSQGKAAAKAALTYLKTLTYPAAKHTCIPSIIKSGSSD